MEIGIASAAGGQLAVAPLRAVDSWSEVRIRDCPRCSRGQLAVAPLRAIDSWYEAVRGLYRRPEQVLGVLNAHEWRPGGEARLRVLRSGI